jgi:hypothetical protein
MPFTLKRASRHAAVAPGVSENGRGDAKTYDIGQRIELHAEFRVGAGHARDAPVQRVEQNGNTDGFCGVIEILAAAHERGDRSVVAA